MIVEFFKYGAGLSKGPLDYFLGKKRDREHAKILSGNEQEVAGLIDSSPFAKKYTSGCLSFYESDLSDEAKRKIMADFEHCLFPGMSSDQYRVLWIEHRDKINEETGERRLELNFLIPNTEILTGNRLQPFYHEADMPRVDLFKKIINFEHQLHDPDDPMFRQDIKTKKSLPKNTADIKRVLDVAARKQIEGGFITDRESMKQWLIDLGLDVTKETAKAISIKNPYGDENSRPIRLEGAIYEQNFRFGAEGDSLTAEASERYRREARKRYRENLQRYAEQIDGKIREFQQKYQQRDAELEKAGHASHERAKDPNLDQQGGVEKSAERSHERDYRADYNRQEDVAESTYTSNQRTSGSPPEASRELTGELARVELLTRRDSTPSDFEKSPYYVSLAVDYSSWRFSYEQYRNRTLSKSPKKSVKPNEPSNQGFTNEGSNLESFDLRQTIVCTDRSEIHDLRGQLQNSSGEVNEQSRSAAIADYRGTTAAIEAATTAAARSLDAYSGSSTDYRRARELHRDFERQEQQANRQEQSVSGADNHLSGDSEKAIRANSLRAFFRGFTERIGDRFKDACDEIGEFFRRTRRIEKLVKGDFAEPGASRNREANEATGEPNQRENELSRAVSTKVSGFNPGYIFKALDELDKRKELQAKQRAAERSSGLDCEM